MSGAIPPLPQYVSMAWGLVKAQGQLHLYLYVYYCTLVYLFEQKHVRY